MLFILIFRQPLSPGKTNATFWLKIWQHCWAQHVAPVWPPCCDMLGVLNRTSPQALTHQNDHAIMQHPQNVAWKIWPFSNLSSIGCKSNTIWVKLTNHFQRTRLITPSNDKHTWLWRWGCRNVSHQQQFLSELPSTGRSHYTNYWYSWVQTIYYKTHHVATRLNRVAKRAQHVAPNNVAMCCVEMLRSYWY